MRDFIREQIVGPLRLERDTCDCGICHRLASAAIQEVDVLTSNSAPRLDDYLRHAEECPRHRYQGHN